MVLSPISCLDHDLEVRRLFLFMQMKAQRWLLLTRCRCSAKSSSFPPLWRGMSPNGQ